MFTVGIDLGGTNIAVGLLDGDYKIVDRMKKKTEASRTPDEIVSDMASITRDLLKRNGLSPSELDNIGIATPGLVDAKRGILEKCCNLPFRSYPLAERMSSLLDGARVHIANDANAAALAEAMIGAAKGTRNSVMLTLGTGVGSGIIIDGRIFSGGLNCSGAEIGHMVIKANGRQCACGRRGCVECYCSAVGLANMTREKMHELEMKDIPSKLFDVAREDGKIGARTPFKAKKLGDEHARAIVDKYVKYLGLAVANIINIFQPEVISIGGGVSNEGDNLIIPLREVADSEQYTRDNEIRTKICVAELGTDAGIIGAAGLCG